MTVRAVLFDIEGTLTSNGRAIPGSVDAIDYCRALGIEVRFLTNMTGRSNEQISIDLSALGIACHRDEVHTAVNACLSILKQVPDATCHLMLPRSTMEMFDAVERNDVNPEFVVIGDLVDSFSYPALNRAFQMLRNGAELLVFHRNLFWLTSEGPKLDSGAFILGLEAASGKSSTVSGKPSATFYEAVLAGLKCERDSVLIVGDDITTDVAGGKGIGVRTILVGTGKSAGDQKFSEFKEDFYLKSVAELPRLLDSLAY